MRRVYIADMGKLDDPTKSVPGPNWISRIQDTFSESSPTLLLNHSTDKQID